AAMPAIDRAAPLETRIEAHVRMGRALAAMGRAQGAAIEMSRVLVIARDRASAAAALKRRGKDAATDAETEDAIAEARFLQAEQPPPAPPPPPPAPSPPGVIGLINSGGGDPNAPITLKDDPFSTHWPVSPPSIRWAIAAAARVGATWGDFVREIRSMPIPREW